MSVCAAAAVERYKRIKEEAAALSNGVPVLVLPVTKQTDAALAMALYDAGARDFGESRVEEIEAKTSMFPDDVRWHLVGHLQSRKAKRAAAVSSFIHSVDSPRLLSKLKECALPGRIPELFIEVNISAEETKYGLCAKDVIDNAAEFASVCGASIKGLMTMAPFGADEKTLRFVFGSLRQLRENINALGLPGLCLRHLSMGMSSDYRIAVQEGATIVRIGSKIFGDAE